MPQSGSTRRGRRRRGAAGPGAAARSPAGDPALAALADELAAMPASASIDSLLDAPDGGFPVGGAAVATPDATGGRPAGADGARTALPAVASLRVLDGPAAGQELALTRDEVVVGRPGRAVAAIRRTAAGLRLVPLEGGAVTVNGAVAGPKACRSSSATGSDWAASRSKSPRRRTDAQRHPDVRRQPGPVAAGATPDGSDRPFVAGFVQVGRSQSHCNQWFARTIHPAEGGWHALAHRLR